MLKILQRVSKSLALLLVVFFVYMYIEPIMADAATTATQDFVVTQSVSGEISMTNPADVLMNGIIGGMSGGTSTGITSFTVVSNNATGFTTVASALTSPALVKAVAGTSFSDYANAGDPTHAWATTTTSAFGYNVKTSDPADAAAFKYTDTTCSTGGTLNDDTHCWRGFTTSPYTIIDRGSKTTVDGVTETLNLQAQLAANQVLESGSYVATITLTSAIK